MMPVRISDDRIQYEVIGNRLLRPAPPIFRKDRGIERLKNVLQSMFGMAKSLFRTVSEHRSGKDLVAMSQFASVSGERLSRRTALFLKYRQFNLRVQDSHEVRNFCRNLLSPMLTRIRLRKFEEPT